MYTLKIQKILNQVERLRIPEEKVKLLAQAVVLADEHNDLEWAYDLRLHLIDIERDVAFPTESIPAYAWILQAYDENPTLFNESDFMWQYKWMLSDLYENPEVSREQLEATLEDFKMRLDRNGYGLRAYYNELLDDTLNQKDLEKLPAALARVHSVQRDDMADCEACEMDNEVTATMYLEGVEQAHKKALPLLEKQFTCNHVPVRTVINLTYWAFKSGDIEKGKSLLPIAESELQNFTYDSSILLSVAKFIVSIAHVDPIKAKEYLERYIPLSHGPDNRYSMLFSYYMTEALYILSPSLTLQLNLDAEHGLYKNGQDVYSSAELISYYKEIVARIAEKFDRRNGNSNITNSVADIFKN